jgi:translation initiation factor IF-3
VPIPRRFDRTPPERDQTRINERIRVPEVRLIGDNGEQVGVVPTPEALAYAQERDLDLVEVAPEARPPVVRVLDYSKYKYQQEQKAKEARRHQQQVTVREIKLRPKIAVHDYETKKGHVERFLRGNDRVKITIMFRGREASHPERGERLLMRLADDVAELGTIEQRPSQDGRNMTMLLGPTNRPRQEKAAGDKAVSEDGARTARQRGKRRAEEAPAEATPADAEPAAEAGATEESAAEPAPPADEGATEASDAKVEAAEESAAEPTPETDAEATEEPPPVAEPAEAAAEDAPTDDTAPGPDGASEESKKSSKSPRRRRAASK